MFTTRATITASQLAALPDDGSRYELVRGVLQMMSPAGAEHGRVAMRLGSLLEQFARENDLGEVYAAETGFLLGTDPDTVRAPDVAFICRARLAAFSSAEGYLPLAPDLVAEVVSPRDSWSRVQCKTTDWLTAGCRMVLVVDPANRTVHVYRGSGRVQVLHQADTLDGGDMVPLWRCRLADLFS